MLYPRPSGWDVSRLHLRLTYCTRKGRQGSRLWINGKTVFHLFDSGDRLTVWRIHFSNSEEPETAAWERSGLAKYARRLMTLQKFKDLHELLANKTTYVMEDQRLSERSGVTRFRLTALARSLVSATTGSKPAILSQIGRPARSGEDIIKSDDEKNVVGAKASFAVEVHLEASPYLLYYVAGGFLFSVVRKSDAAS